MYILIYIELGVIEPGVKQWQKKDIIYPLPLSFLKHASYEIIPANPPSNTIPAVSPTGEILYYLDLAMKGNNILRHSYRKYQISSKR